MASSGSVSTTGYGGRHLVLSWSQVSQSIANNTTTISWTLKGAGSASFSYCYARNFTVVINGVTVLTRKEIVLKLSFIKELLSAAVV